VADSPKALAPEEGSDSGSPTTGTDRGADGELWFDDDFESGNLAVAHRIDLSHEPESVAAARRRVLAEASLAGAAPLPVDQEYALRMRSDLNTTGNTQWFYFAVRGAKRGQTVRFRVENHTKPDSLFNYGLRPLVLSKRLVQQPQSRPHDRHNDGRDAQDEGESQEPPLPSMVAATHPADDAPEPGTGWHHGGFDCCYFQSQESYFRPRGKSRKRQLYVASFSYTFPFDDDVVFFAYCRPYTYTRLQRLLGALESSRSTKRVVYRRKLCSTLAGNRCDVLSIGSAITSPADHLRRKGAFLSARVHPGETNASWMMAGVLRFITSSAPAAVVLRRHCVTRIVPMLNPDGVIMGNYRCSLAGQDLNR
jgi:hypothetical protein